MIDSNPTPPSGSSSAPQGSSLKKSAQVIVVSSVMFTFISYWRVAAVVLCDLASTAYYIGGIVEQSVGPAAPWFILAVMTFSYAVRSVYIESCSMFVRGGVYKVVKEAMGGFLAKLSVSALMFDFILTGPISGVSAGQYLIGLILEIVGYINGAPIDDGVKAAWKGWGSVAIACLITLYFFRENIRGIHESSDKALKIMIATTVMALVIGVWSGVTLIVEGPKNPVLMLPDLGVKIAPSGEEASPLGFLKHGKIADDLANLGKPGGGNWLSLLGVMGLFIAFGHSVLAMSGEETLAQVYREVESPKLPNFKKAAFIVFVYSFILTGGISFLAVMLIPNDVRMKEYSENLISGLAQNMYGPQWACLSLNAFVVIIGFLILAGAVNTAIIGSNGVLNRVAEDGVIPDWFLKPHKRYGTTYRMLWLILGLQLFTIIASRGDVLLLGEAYAFGVVWSFVFNSMAMLVLRFKFQGVREYKVPLNIRIGQVEIPIGLGLIFLVLFIAALMNLATKELATIWGIGFTSAFLIVFLISEHYRKRSAAGVKHEHREQFNQQATPAVSIEGLGLTQAHCKLVAIRSPNNLFMLETALSETDPESTDVVVMTAKVQLPGGEPGVNQPDLDTYDQQLMTAVVDRAERAGKKVTPMIVPTNSPLHAVLRTAKELKAKELLLGASNKFSAEEQLDQISFYWISLHGGNPTPLTVRILSRDRDVYFDLEGGSRIPKITERQAKTVAELRAAGIGVNRVLMAHDGTQTNDDLFRIAMTMLDPLVVLDLVVIPPVDPTATVSHSATGQGLIEHDVERAHHVGRELTIHRPEGEIGAAIVRLAHDGEYDLVLVAVPQHRSRNSSLPGSAWFDQHFAEIHCPVLLAVMPEIPQGVVE